MKLRAAGCRPPIAPPPWCSGRRARVASRAFGGRSLARRSLQGRRSASSWQPGGRSRRAAIALQGPPFACRPRPVRAPRGLRAHFWCTKRIPGKGFGCNSRPRGRSWRSRWRAAPARAKSRATSRATLRSERAFSRRSPGPAIAPKRGHGRLAPAQPKSQPPLVATLDVLPPPTHPHLLGAVKGRSGAVAESARRNRSRKRQSPRRKPLRPSRELAEIAREGRRGVAQNQPRARPNRRAAGLRSSLRSLRSVRWQRSVGGQAARSGGSSGAAWPPPALRAELPRRRHALPSVAWAQSGGVQWRGLRPRAPRLGPSGPYGPGGVATRPDPLPAARPPEDAPSARAGGGPGECPLSPLRSLRSSLRPFARLLSRALGWFSASPRRPSRAISASSRTGIDGLRRGLWRFRDRFRRAASPTAPLRPLPSPSACVLRGGDCLWRVASRGGCLPRGAGAGRPWPRLGAIAGPGDLRLKARCARALAVENDPAATRCAPGCHLDRQERPRGREQGLKPFPGMRLTLEKCARRPLEARTDRPGPRIVGPWTR